MSINPTYAEFLKRILDLALKQGLSLTLMLVYGYYITGKVESLEKKVDNCQGEQIELLKTTIKENTEAFKSFTQEWKEIKHN